MMSWNIQQMGCSPSTLGPNTMGGDHCHCTSAQGPMHPQAWTGHALATSPSAQPPTSLRGCSEPNRRLPEGEEPEKVAKLLGGCGPDRFKDPGPRAGPLDSCDTAPGGGGGVSAPSAAQQPLGPGSQGF